MASLVDSSSLVVAAPVDFVAFAVAVDVAGGASVEMETGDEHFEADLRADFATDAG